MTKDMLAFGRDVPDANARSLLTGWRGHRPDALLHAQTLWQPPAGDAQRGSAQFQHPVPVQNADFAKFAAALAPAGMDCLKASLKKSKDAISNCTDVLSQACDNCHKVYRDAPPK